MNKSLNWNQRFAVIDKYKPTDDQICKVFGVSQTELNTARQLRSAGQFIPSTNINIDSFESLFSDKSTSSVVRPEQIEKPMTATKRTKEPKKRGRKGDKIKNAFAAIPNSPTPAEEFAKSHNVSLTVLRQSKRFDSFADKGRVHVKKVALKENGEKVLSIWRDADA